MNGLIEIGDPPARALTVAEPIIIGEAMLSAEEARQIVKNINGRFEQSRKDLMELEDRQGWKALGYNSWRACVMAEFSQSVATLYRQLEAAKIEREIFGDVSQVETPTPTSQLQVVKNLPTDQKRAAFKRADQIAGDQPRTTVHVQQAAAEIAAPDLPPNYDIVKRRFVPHGVALTHELQNGALLFVRKKGTGTPIATLDWQIVLNALSLLEDGMDVEPIDSPPPPAAPDVPTLAELDTNRMPDDLHKAGYYWHSATPPTIARNGSNWRGDAQTVEKAIEVARTHKDAKTEPIVVFPPMNQLECKALYREAVLFLKAGGDRKFPTIGKALIDAVEAIKGAA